MKRITATVIVLLLVATSSMGQSRREWLDFGDQAFNRQDYMLAVYCYKHVLNIAAGNDRDAAMPYEIKQWTPPPKKSLTDSAHAADTLHKDMPSDPRVVYVTHRLAECYRYLRAYDDAEAWYAKAVAWPSDQFPDARYWYGNALMNNKKYEQAMHELEGYAADLPPESPQTRKAARCINGCLFALDSNSVKKEVIVAELDSSINAGVSNFAASYYGDPNALVFTSARPGNVATPDRVKLGLGAYSTDLYTARISNGQWSTPAPMNTQFNTTSSEGSATVSFGMASLFFTRWSEDKKESSIYMCKNVNDVWLQPLKLGTGVNMPGYHNVHPYLSNDGTTLYFSSDRPGGQGGYDIWMCTIDENGEAGTPVNMGNIINSPDDEITPYYHFTTHTLFYSSNGLGGFGGQDIFKTAFNPEDSTWTMPKNLEAPFNSSRDDAYFVMDRIQQHGYFSSDRTKCTTCGETGYCYRIFSFMNEPLVFGIHGVVYNKDTNEPIPNSLLTFKDIRGDADQIYLITDSVGHYATPLQIDQEWYIKAQKNNYFGDATNISTIGLTDSREFEHNFYLTPIRKGVEFELPGIEYDYNKTTLRPESKKVLDDLVEFLKLNDNISVEIASHTDTRGSDTYNQRLSQGRAQSCVDYLIASGIAADRLQATGYGETKPLIPDKELYALPYAQQDAAHQKNRRTAFRPIKEGTIRDKWEGILPPKK